MGISVEREHHDITGNGLPLSAGMKTYLKV
jgi:hypothetical protein